MDGGLLILGAGQFGMMVKEIADSLDMVSKIDFLDDNNPIAIGRLCDFPRFVDSYPLAIVAIGNSMIRLDYANLLEKAGYTVPALISPRAFVSDSAVVSSGCIIEPMAVVQTRAYIGKGCIISSGAVIRHNATVEDGCHCDCNSVVKSNTILPRGSKLDCGKIYVEKI